MRLGIITQNSIEGGLDTFLINLITNIKNHEIVLFYNKNKNIDKIQSYIQDKNIKIIRYSFKVSNDIDNKNNKFIKKILNIYFYTLNIYLLSRKLSKVFLQNKIDELLVVNGGYPGGEVCLSSIIAWSKINKKNKAFFNVHNYPISTKDLSTLRKIYENYIDKLISDKMRLLITVSNSCKNAFKIRPNIDSKKLIYIHNGFSKRKYHKNFSLKKNKNIKKNDKIVLLPAVFEERKGQEVAIRAFQDILKYQKNIHLIICGEGSNSQKNKLINLINKLNLSSNIHILPFNINVESYYSEADIVIIPSLSMESFGYTAIEAMSFKIPVIASNIGGLKEIIINNESGFLVKPKDHIEFSKKIRSIINNNTLKHNLSVKGYNRYIENFSSKLMTEKYISLIIENNEK